VDADTESELNPNADDVEFGEMKSKPTFTVDIVRGNQTLGFTCSFNKQAGASGADDSYSKYICNLLYCLFMLFIFFKNFI